MNELYEMYDDLESVIYLGEGTSFDLTSYEGYENFTIDNFIVEPVTTELAEVPGGMAHNANYIYMALTLNKTYSDGILSANILSHTRIINASAKVANPTRTYPVKAYLVLK